jgi:hypothetical protein
MPHRNSAVTALLKRPIAFHPILARISGSVTAGIMLSQALYWTGVVEEKQQGRGGWFYKTQKDWRDETCLSRWEQETARKLLRQKDFWFERRRGQPARLWFRVDIDRLAAAIRQYEQGPHSSVRENGTRDGEESTDKVAEEVQAISETTAKNTSENLGRFAASSAYSSMDRKTPQQKRWAIIARLAGQAEKLLRDAPGISHADLVEILKNWAAAQGIPYFDAWPGSEPPIEQAIKIARERCA